MGLLAPFGLSDPSYRVSAGLLQPEPVVFGNRADGSKKGRGWLGVLPRPDGGVSTELSIGVQIDGKEVEIPLLVPTLDQSEVLWLLKNDNQRVPDQIVRKAYDFALQRVRLGLSPFAEDK